MLRRANTGYQDGKYSVIAGHLDGGELATRALAREAKEEAGISVDAKNMTFVHAVHRLDNRQGSERVDFFFEADQWTGEITNAEPNKCDDLSWFRLDRLPENMLPLIRLVLIDVERGINYSEYVHEPI